jgi:hypothetical protein
LATCGPSDDPSTDRLLALQSAWRGVSHSGSRLGVAIRRQLRSDAVRGRDRGRFNCSDVQQRHQAAALLARALSSGRRGRRFKSGHPDQLTGHLRSWQVAFHMGRVTNWVTTHPDAAPDGRPGRSDPWHRLPAQVPAESAFDRWSQWWSCHYGRPAARSAQSGRQRQTAAKRNCAAARAVSTRAGQAPRLGQLSGTSAGRG